MRTIGRALGALMLGFLCWVPAAPGQSQAVDVALVLAIDVSGSINIDRWELQRRGYAAAFKSPEVIAAIAGGQHKAIAVTMVEWSGSDHQEQVVPWTIIRDEVSAAAFSSAMGEAPRVFSDWTSISGALDFSAALFARSGIEAPRRVIDVSGDGVNNNGRPITDARDAALAQGIVINGLPILTDYAFLDEYYRDNVIGGPNAFIEVVQDYAAFGTAVLNKLVREIARGERPAHASATRPSSTK